MRFHAVALASCASVFFCSRARADERLPAPKLVLDDVVGFGTTGSTGWFAYSRLGSHSNADVQPEYTRLEQRSKTSQLSIAPRIEMLFGEYVSLGAELTYARISQGTDAFAEGATMSQSLTSNRITLVPILGVRVPLPHRLSLWGHAGFGGGAAITSRTSSATVGSPADEPDDSAQLVTRFRADIRVGYEPVRGVMLVAGPELQRTAFGNDKTLGSSSYLSAGVWAGVSFVIR